VGAMARFYCARQPQSQPVTLRYGRAVSYPTRLVEPGVGGKQPVTLLSPAGPCWASTLAPLAWVCAQTLCKCEEPVFHKGVVIDLTLL
jgi:hypothetical protein